MQIDEITDQFEEIESDHSFSTNTTRHAWERIRNDTYRQIVSNHTEIGQAQENPHITFFQKILMALQALLTSLMMLVKGFTERKVLIYGHQRRKDINGEYWDIYIDPVLEETGLEDYLYLESAWQYRHSTPRYTDNVVETDFIDIGAKVARRFMSDQLKDGEQEELRELQEKLEGIGLEDYNIIDEVERILQEDPVKRWWYRRILRQVQPETVLLVVSYGKEGFIRECQEEDVPVWELQHGTMNRYHKGYDRRRFKKEAFPDHLLLYGEYWQNITQFPIEEDHIDILGNPFFHRQADRKNATETDIDVLFLSQPSISDQLSSFALQVAQQTGKHVVYKPHPGENNIMEKYAELRSAGVTIKTEEGLYSLIGRSEKVVGVYTTAIYESLALGRPVYILQTDGWKYVEDLVNKGLVVPLNEPKDLDRTAPQEIDTEAIFAPPKYDVLPF